MSVMCSAIHVALPTVGETAITGPLAAHVDSCAACWGEVARYRAMYRELETLNPSEYRAPRELVASVTDNLGPVAVEATEPRLDPRVPVAAAAVVATAAAGTAVLYKLYRDHAA
jgi:anti-sigma factor RsiW